MAKEKEPVEAYDEKTDFTVAEKIDHTTIIFHMIERINRAAFIGDDFSLLRGIDTLESDIPKKWEDENYKDEMDTIKQEAGDQELLLGVNTSEEDKRTTFYRFAQKKFRALMNLLDRRGLFGEREIEEVI